MVTAATGSYDPKNHRPCLSPVLSELHGPLLALGLALHPTKFSRDLRGCTGLS